MPSGLAMIPVLLAAAASTGPTGPSAAPAASAAPASPTATAAPPVAARHDHRQTWHGETVNDPWFWLREKENPEVRGYLEAENAYTQAMTAAIAPFASALYDEMLARIQQTDLSVPQRRDAFCYYTRTVEGLQYPIHARRPAAKDGSCGGDGPEEVLLDLNEMAKGKAFISLGALAVSDDARRILFTTDETGFRQYDLFVKELATGAVKGPLARRVTSAAWAADSATLFFTTEDEVTKRSDSLWRLSPGAEPVRLHREEDELFAVHLGRTNDRRLLVLSILSTDTWEARILDARTPEAAFRVVEPRRKGVKYAVEHRDGVLYVRTNDGARDFRLATAPVKTPGRKHWKPFLAGRTGEKIVDVEPFRDFLVVTTQQAGLPRFRVWDFRKKAWSEVAFPDPVYAADGGVMQVYDSGTFRFRYESLASPPAVYDQDLAKGTRTLLKQEEVLGGFDPARYASARLWATARDGAKVPVSIVHRKDVKPDGTAPLWLYGYGSYGYGMPAGFSSTRLSLLDRGVVFAIAHVRGGDEMGETWHDDGMLMKKKNTFHDFVDAARFLVKESWAAPDRVLIEGGSAGGLLMGAVVNEEPGLFRAVHAAVPFVDVMNTMMDASLPLTVGEYLEWGDPNDRAAFDYMRSYSPYDNVAAKAYPAMLVTTSWNDSQVMYWEPAKWVAKLRATKTDANPLLLKTKLEPAGHGGASGRYDALRDRAFEVAWMLSQVGIGR
ncbi:MAG TPA: S9 family peptidase [Anaeromyxobacteraceae bacterium]|nr:S9 family peptidase [Anaeromyxobacteraceae bacterium]